MKKFNKKKQKQLARFAAVCAFRVLPFFEKKFPKDKRPRTALLVLSAWMHTGIFSMKTIRKASLDAHASARMAKAKGNDAACFAARACGQAVATAHAAGHAFGASYYALKVAEARNTATAENKSARAGRNAHPQKEKFAVAKELEWQEKHFPKPLLNNWREWKLQKLPKRFTPVKR